MDEAYRQKILNDIAILDELLEAEKKQQEREYEAYKEGDGNEITHEQEMILDDWTEQTTSYDDY